jgi:hypothetical protein
VNDENTEALELLKALWAAIEGKDTRVSIVALSCALGAVVSATTVAAIKDGIDAVAIEKILDGLSQRGLELGKNFHKDEE